MFLVIDLDIMTSSKGNISVLLSLCEENPAVIGGFPSDAELWCFLRSAPEQTVERQSRPRWL